jgi:hypothetical protein
MMIVAKAESRTPAKVVGAAGNDRLQHPSPPCTAAKSTIMRFGYGAKWRISTWAYSSHEQHHHRHDGHREIAQAGVVDQLILPQQAPKLLDEGTLRC